MPYVQVLLESLHFAILNRYWLPIQATVLVDYGNCTFQLTVFEHVIKHKTCLTSWTKFENTCASLVKTITSTSTDHCMAYIYIYTYLSVLFSFNASHSLRVNVLLKSRSSFSKKLHQKTVSLTRGHKHMSILIKESCIHGKLLYMCSYFIN